MRKNLRYVTAACITLIFLSFISIAHSHEIITLPVRFHLVTDMPMTKNGLKMHNWITKADIEKTILPEVNRLWQPANISFVQEKTLYSPALNPPNKNLLLEGIVKAHRNKQGKSDPSRITKLNQLIDWENHHVNVINIYVIPYLGETSQGNAKRKHQRIFLGQWSDKASKARKPPEKFQLTEARPFKKGSFSRTLAHELGHILRLKHPNKATQKEFGLLMGGKKPGYRIREHEIEIARKKAAQLVDRLLSWADNENKHICVRARNERFDFNTK